jgi:hypothetical protein
VDGLGDSIGRFSIVLHGIRQSPNQGNDEMHSLILSIDNHATINRSVDRSIGNS